MRPLKVGLNLLHLVPGETGGSEIYARRLDPRPGRDRSRRARPARFRGGGAGDPRGAVGRKPRGARSCRSARAGRGRRVMAEQLALPRAARRAGVDLLHNLFSTAPARPRRAPGDHHPRSDLPPVSRGALAAPEAGDAGRRSPRGAAIDADHRDLGGHQTGRRLHAGRGPGPRGRRLRGSRLLPGSSRLRGGDPARRHSLGEAPIVLSVSAHRPHKNLERLIEAVAALEQPAVLVVPGYETPWEGEIAGASSGPGRRSECASSAGSATRSWRVSRSAACLAFPSLAEGFGLPVLEAMARGLPVACSNTTSLPEVAGAAALYFDPTDVAAMGEAIGRLLDDPALAAAVVRRRPEAGRVVHLGARGRGHHLLLRARPGELSGGVDSGDRLLRAEAGDQLVHRRR